MPIPQYHPNSQLAQYQNQRDQQALKRQVDFEKARQIYAPKTGYNNSKQRSQDNNNKSRLPYSYISQQYQNRQNTASDSGEVEDFQQQSSNLNSSQQQNALQQELDNRAILFGN